MYHSLQLIRLGSSLSVLFFFAGVIIFHFATEPICAKCLSTQVQVSGLSYPGICVTEYKCERCSFKWKPLNLHRATNYGCYTIFR